MRSNPMLLLLLAYAWIAMNAFAPPVQAANYDGGVLFHFNCRQDNGQWSGWNVSANVKEGKFKSGRKVSRSEEGCKIDGCWMRWEGTIEENGRYRLTYQENRWDQKSSKALNTWMVVGQFTSKVAGQGTATDYPNWISQCKDSTVSLVDPAPESLAGREEIARAAAVAANTGSQGKAAELVSAKSDALSAMMEANLLLPELAPGSNRTLLETAIQGMAEAIKADTADQILTQSKLLSQLVQTVRNASISGSDTANSAPVASRAVEAILPQSIPQKRVALVIGNSAYRNAAELPNPRNDARAISTILRGLKFEVIEGEDLTKVDMDERIRRFADAVGPADLALFFYAGHGMQVAGKNYLIPIDAKLENSSALDFETTDAEQVMNYMANSKRISVALLDACRDNPLARQFARSVGVTRSANVSRGLAPLSVENGGLLIGFATSPGDVALDGTGSNSPFTSALITHLADKGLEIEQMLKRVKADVIKATGNRQRPWINSDVASDVYLNP